MDLSTEFLFGQSVNSQSNALYSQESGNTADMQEQISFANAMTTAQEFISLRFRIRFFYHFLSKTKFNAACRTVQNFTARFVDIALRTDHKNTARTATGKPKFTLLNELTKETRDPIELRNQMLNVLLAGRDTTSAAIGWAICELSRRPDEFETLRNAIISHFGTLSNPTQELTFESLKACKEITYVIYETLRLYPLVPLNGRFALKDTILPVGGGEDGKSPIVVMKGENVGFSAYVMHRRTDVWGEDAMEFRPARWEKRKLGWEYVPFSGGPRVCLGREFSSFSSYCVRILFAIGFLGILGVVRVLADYDRTICDEQHGLCDCEAATAIRQNRGFGYEDTLEEGLVYCLVSWRWSED
jgi:hypothetical protein